ncbi:Bug family tripartite tricarboxylate transporter substrate binding protein [Ramlibacter albus]|uniref:Tripartite tricarboxylate transporter substrate binding protein n=1 Tax=Ramlibacter albus TaxID=2079448 RepID=A0A923S560_9BURK|nr:tripartite tricarboxylate transporter substrate binding protein [Ramlibacter albus]MBC5768230.1 tripartite tricarboxylate transporter substrate binding protein [Ramlibacter albus]
MQRRHVLPLLAATLAAPCGAFAQAYPVRPVRLIVPFPPGGVYDSIGRPWADSMKRILGTVEIENLGGGGGSVGAAAAAHARPDGYTLLLGGTLTHVNEMLLKAKPLYDAAKDLEPVAGVAVSYLAIAVHPTLPVRTLPELVDYAKNRPELAYAHVGIGSSNHLTGELFKSMATLPRLVDVPYRGAGPALADMVSGQVLVGIAGVTGNVLEFHRTGKLRVLAVTSSQRLAAAPDIPTVAEMGYAGLAAPGALGILAPAGTPKDIIDRVASATRSAVAEPAFQKRLVDGGFEPMLDSGPDEFRKVLAAAVTLWSPVVKRLALKID